MSTENIEYTSRLKKLSAKKWKQVLDVQRPYRNNLRKLNPGITLDVGCGIGRYLTNLPTGSVGVDHNKHSIGHIKRLGLEAYTTPEFLALWQSKNAKQFDSLLFGHVLEHMTPDQGYELLMAYLPFIKTGGQVIVMCPQKRGYASDATHVTFLDSAAISGILSRAEVKTKRAYSFPFPAAVGKVFRYNETVVVGKK